MGSAGYPWVPQCAMSPLGNETIELPARVRLGDWVLALNDLILPSETTHDKGHLG